MRVTAPPIEEPLHDVDEDPFHDPLMGAIGIAGIVVTLAIFLLTGLMHWGVMYHSPSWSSHSVPTPVVHMRGAK
jgi:hypothetical protein